MAKKFVYHTPSKETIQKRAEGRTDGEYDNPFNTSCPIFTPKEGDHRIRILPPTWEGSEHFSIDCYLHYGVGPNNERYLCLRKHGKGECPVCTEMQRADREGDKDYATKISPKHREAVYMIDRKAEKKGVQLWPMPHTKVAREIMKRARDSETGETFFIDHPDKGYDVKFSIEGSQKTTQYTGVDIARKSTPLSDDEAIQDKWIEFAQDNPLPDTLTFYSAKHIAATFAGKDPDSVVDDEDKPRTRKPARDEEEDEQPRRKRAEPEDEEETPKPKRRVAEDDEEEAPPRRKRSEPDEDEEPAPKPKRRAEAEEEDEERPKRTRLNKGGSDEDEEPAPKPKRRAEPEEEDEEPAPRRRRAEPEEEEEPAPKPKRRAEPEDEDEPAPKPKRRSEPDEEEEEEAPRRPLRRRE